MTKLKLIIKVNCHLKTLQTPSLPLSASWSGCQNNIVPFLGTNLTDPYKDFHFNDLPQPLSSSSQDWRTGVFHRRCSGNCAHQKISHLNLPKAHRSRMGTKQRPLDREWQTRQSGHLSWYKIPPCSLGHFWFATIWIYIYRRWLGNTSLLSIHVLFFLPSLFIKFVGTKICYLFFEYTLPLAQDQLRVNSCHRWYATLMVDIVKLLVNYIFSIDSGVLHFWST